MKAQLLGIKEFRQNLSFYTKKALAEKLQLIILKQNKPVLEINPILENKPIEIAEVDHKSLSEVDLKLAKETYNADNKDFINI